MVIKTSRAKKKYCLNCLLVAEDASFALETKDKAEDLGLKVITIASTEEQIWDAFNTHSIDIILSDEKLNTTKDISSLYRSLDNLPPLVLFSDLDANVIGKTIESKSINTCVKISKSFGDIALKSAVSDVLRDRINALKKGGDIQKVKDVIYLRVSGKLISIGTNAVQYIKSEGNYCTIHVQSKRYVIRSSITNVLKTLDNPNFIQIHRGYIANLNLSNQWKVRNGSLFVADKKLPIGRKYKNDLLSMLKNIEVKSSHPVNTIG